MGSLAMGATLVDATVTIIDAISACCIQLNKDKPNTGGCCSDTKKEDGMGEYGSVVIILVVLASVRGSCLAFQCVMSRRMQKKRACMGIKCFNSQALVFPKLQINFKGKPSLIKGAATCLRIFYIHQL